MYIAEQCEVVIHVKVCYIKHKQMHHRLGGFNDGMRRFNGLIVSHAALLIPFFFYQFVSGSVIFELPDFCGALISVLISVYFTSWDSPSISLPDVAHLCLVASCLFQPLPLQTSLPLESSVPAFPLLCPAAKLDSLPVAPTHCVLNVFVFISLIMH